MATKKKTTKTKATAAKKTTKKRTTTKRKPAQTKLGSYGRKVLKARKTQTGKSDVSSDKKRKAMQPGKRRSASGRVYSESRKNRSDLKGKMV